MIKLLAALVKMQSIEDLISEKQNLKKRLPLQLEELEKNVTSAEQLVDESKKLIDNNIKERDKLDLEVKVNLEKIAKYETQLSAIKTNKEYKALSTEMDFLKESNNKIDDKILDSMDEEQGFREILEERKLLYQKAQAELDEKAEKLRKQIVQVDRDIEDYKIVRNEIAKKLPMELVKRYATLIQHKNRKAVVFLNSNKGCGGCGFAVRPQLLIDISRKDTLISCESCGRMLVDKELAEQEE